MNKLLKKSHISTFQTTSLSIKFVLKHTLSGFVFQIQGTDIQKTLTLLIEESQNSVFKHLYKRSFHPTLLNNCPLGEKKVGVIYHAWQ